MNHVYLFSHELINLVKAIGYDIVGSTSFQIPNSLTPYTLVLKK